MKTTALTARGLALARCARIADTTPSVPAIGKQFDGSYVGHDTLLSGVAFLCGAADLPERIEVQKIAAGRNLFAIPQGKPTVSSWRARERNSRMQPNSKRPVVVIIGAGFGGITAARTLAGGDVDILVIDRTNHHVFQPLLYQTATAAIGAVRHREPGACHGTAQSRNHRHHGEVTGVDPHGAWSRSRKRASSNTTI